MSNIGEKFKYKRKARGLTQRELSRLTGLSSSFISQLETGSRGSKLSYNSATKLAKGLKVSISFFNTKSLHMQTLMNDSHASLEQ